MSQRVLSFHYTLANQQGEPLDSSRERAPLSILEGSQMVIPALEKALFEMQVGEAKKVELKAEEAYGPVREEFKGKMNRSELPEGPLEVGTQFQAGPEQGSRVFTVTAIEGDEVSLDGNHPLAGVDLVFDVEVTEIREATKEELSGGKDSCCSDPSCNE